MRVRLYSVKNGQRISAGEGNVRTILSMMALPGLRESIVITNIGVIRKISKQLTTTGFKTAKGEMIHLAKLENEYSFEYILVIEDKKIEESAECQIISIWYEKKNLYSMERETDAKRILFLDILTDQ